MKIKFIKPPLGSKALNTDAIGKMTFFKKALSHLNCTSCKKQTTITAFARNQQHVGLEFDYCCPSFQEIIQNEQKRWMG